MERFKSVNIVIIAILFLTGCKSVNVTRPGIVINQSFPRLVLSSQDIVSMQQNALSGKEPFESCYKSLRELCSTAVSGSWTASPYFGDDGMSFYNGGQRDGAMVRDLAILWQVTRNRKYADAAIGILEQWTSGESFAGTRINDSTDSGEGGMLAARGIFPFLYGYDLLMADNLPSEALQKRFCQWVKDLVPVIKEGARRWKINDYYDRQYYQNHPAAETLGILAIAVILGDDSLLQYAFDSDENERDILDLVEGCILMEGDEPYYREPAGYPVHDGEIYDRYRHFQRSGHYKDYVTKPDRGLQYCCLTTTLLVAAAEICRNNGFDLYSWEGEHGESIFKTWKHYARYFSTHDCSGSIYQGEEWFININDQASSALWEIAAARYPGEKSFREVLDNNDRTVNCNLHLFGNVVLTHGK